MKLINNIKEMYKTMTYARTIGLVLALLLTSTAVWAVSSVTNGFDAGWFTGDVANTTVGGVSLANILGTDGENITSKKIGGVIYANQYATLQDAINAANPNKSVFAPCGTYTFSTNQTVFDNLELNGAGECTIIKIVPGSTAHAFYIYNNKNFTLNNFVIDMTGQSGIVGLAALQPTGIVIGATDGDLLLSGTIKNIKIISPYWGIVGLGGTDVSLENNKIYYPFETGIHTDNNKNWSVKNNKVYDAGTYSYRFSAASKIFTIIGNNAFNATQSCYSLIGLNLSIVSNNIGIDCHSGGIIDEKSTEGGGNYPGGQNIITENSIIHSPLGIVLENTNGSLIGNNKIYNTTSFYALYINGANNNTVVDNQIEMSQNEGIRITNSSGNKVSDNSIRYDPAILPYPALGTYGLKFLGNSYNNEVIDNSFRLQGITEKNFGDGYYNNNTIRDNYGISPYNHGNSATAPSAFGAGDRYFNSTSNIGYTYNSTAWHPDIQNEYTELTVANGVTTGFVVLHPNMVLNSSKVSVNGTVKYYGGSYDYTENVTHIIFSSAPTVNSKVYITYVSND